MSRVKINNDVKRRFTLKRFLAKLFLRKRKLNTFLYFCVVNDFTLRIAVDIANHMLSHDKPI